MSFFVYIVECVKRHKKYQKTGGVVGTTSMDDGRSKCDCGGELTTPTQTERE